MEEKKYSTVILVCEVGTYEHADEIDRKDLENIENTKFESVSAMFKELGGDNPEQQVSYFELTDFMEACNDEEITSLEGYWIGYVQIELNEFGNLNS